MNRGRSVFAQLMAGIDRTEFERCARRYPLVRRPRTFSAYDHFASMVFAQLTYRQSLRDIETCLNARAEGLYHAGIRGRVSRCNLAYANEHRNWRVFAEVAQVLMRRVRRLGLPSQAGTPSPEVFAFDASLVDVSLALCPWAHRQQAQAAVRLNVLLDTHLAVPAFASISGGDTHEVRTLDELPLRPGAVYVMDRGYLDYARLHRLHTHGVFFLVRAKAGLRFRVERSTKVDRSTGLRCDQLIRLTHPLARRSFPDTLRRVRYRDASSERSFVFLTNHHALPALDVAELYRRRWQVELFFRWIKQHLRLRWFFATSPNGVRVQIWTALCAHLLVAIAQHRDKLPASLYQILQISSVCIWEKQPLASLLSRSVGTTTPNASEHQLIINGF